MAKLNKLIISPRLSIKQVLRHMDEAGEKTLLITDSKRRLLGTVSDGDIRRWILKGKSLNKSVSLVMNRNPHVLKDGYRQEEAKDLFVSKIIECIPIVDTENRIISAIHWLDFFEKKFVYRHKINVPVVIMAGGSGARLSPFTSILPKPLIPIGDKPIVELIMDKFIEFGCSDIYLSVHYKANILKAYFKDSKTDYGIKFIEEERPLGTIGSLYMLKNKIRNTFFLSNCDILIEADYHDMLKFHKNNKNSITLIVSLKHYTIPYGICEIENGGILKSIREKPEYDFLVNTGSYILEPDVLTDIPVDKPYQATDLINDYIIKKKRIGVYPVSEKSWFDIGHLEELQETMRRLNVK